MDAIKLAGLILMGFGFFALVMYGVYNLLIEISSIDPVIFASIAAIIAGILILLASVIAERLKEKEKIDEEDLKT
ncbi:MAG: hypothetical protein DRN29_06060 [Thermoplasmata archaeon]|nr:MAG: hypothetical protein DRN29_06060 [Thermoplasmata archaeon]